MANLSRRGFLTGLLASASAAVVARAIPAPVLPAWPPVFEGAVGQYHGIILREWPKRETHLILPRYFADHIEAARMYCPHVQVDLEKDIPYGQQASSRGVQLRRHRQGDGNRCAADV